MELGVILAIAMGLGALYKLFRELSTGRAYLVPTYWDRKDDPLFFWFAVVADFVAVVVALGGGVFVMLDSLGVINFKQ